MFADQLFEIEVAVLALVQDALWPSCFQAMHHVFDADLLVGEFDLHAWQQAWHTDVPFAALADLLVHTTSFAIRFM